MQFNKETIEHIQGKKFNRGYTINFDFPKKDIIYRDNILLDYVKDKKIIHLGFVDHVPLLEKKIKSGKWLHDKLYHSANLCYGIDINKEGIDYIKQNFHYENLFALDIFLDDIPDKIATQRFDFLLIPDVIEHIGNPVAFLEKIREAFPNVDKFILTTPNAFRLNNIFNSLKNKEVINSDHRFWFTPFTIAKILDDSGFTLEEIMLCEHFELPKLVAMVRNIILKRYTLLQDTLLVIAK